MRHEERASGPLVALFRALLVLDVVWCLASFALPGLPGWKMFAAGASPRWSVVDASGSVVDLQPLLPRHAALQDARTVVELARFACQRDRLKAPAVVTFGRDRVTIEPGCVARW